MENKKETLLWICPICGYVIVRSKEYIGYLDATVKCPKCGKVLKFGDLISKPLTKKKKRI